jgi:hypothetical protein
MAQLDTPGAQEAAAASCQPISARAFIGRLLARLRFHRFGLGLERR